MANSMGASEMASLTIPEMTAFSFCAKAGTAINRLARRMTAEKLGQPSEAEPRELNHTRQSLARAAKFEIMLMSYLVSKLPEGSRFWKFGQVCGGESGKMIGGRQGHSDRYSL